MQKVYKICQSRWVQLHSSLCHPVNNWKERLLERSEYLQRPPKLITISADKRHENVERDFELPGLTF